MGHGAQGLIFVSSSSFDLGQPPHLTGKETDPETGQEGQVNNEAGTNIQSPGTHATLPP